MTSLPIAPDPAPQGASCCAPTCCTPASAPEPPPTADAVRETVRERYGAIARDGGLAAPVSCCGPTCCAPDASLNGYSAEEAAAVVEARKPR